MTAVQAHAQANTINFTVVFHGGNEVPGVVTGGVGNGTVSLNTVTHVVTYNFNIYNIPVGTTAGHFHVGAAGVNGPVVINFTIPANISNDFGIVGTASAADLVPRAAQGINSFEDFEQSLVGGGVYANVHTTANPGGEVRGQVVRVQ